jgi:hypothetical protein
MRASPIGRLLVTRLPKRFRSNVVLVNAIRFVGVAPVAAIFGATGGAALAVVCGLLPIAYAGLVAWRIAVEATTEGLVLRSSVRVRRIPWRDVDHVELLETWPYNAWVVKVDGSRVKTLGLGASGFRHKASMARSRQMVHELNEIRSELLARETHD